MAISLEAIPWVRGSLCNRIYAAVFNLLLYVLDFKIVFLFLFGNKK